MLGNKPTTQAIIDDDAPPRRSHRDAPRARSEAIKLHGAVRSRLPGIYGRAARAQIARGNG